MMRLTNKELVLLIVKATTFVITWMALNFIVNLKSPYCASKSQFKRGWTSSEMICHLPQVHMDVGCNINLSKLPNVKEKYCSYLLKANSKGPIIRIASNTNCSKNQTYNSKMWLMATSIPCQPTSQDLVIN